MKKLLIFISFITIILFSSCNDSCEHLWSDATCDKPKICSLCGEITGDALGHSYSNGKCSICNETDPNYVVPIIAFAISEKTSELNKIKELILSNVDDSIKDNINTLFTKAINEINNVKNINSLNEITNNCLKEVYKLIPIADKDYEFSALDQSEKEKILSLLDEYIYRNNLGGIPISKYYTLNLNSTTKEKWVEFFGTNGSKKQTPENKYWNVKPFLSNEYFLKGLSLALPKNYSNVETTNYYRINYSKYEFYNYNLDLAKKYFSLAMEELFPIYAVSSQYPIQLKLEIAFGTKSKANEELFNSLKNSIETAFNDKIVSNGNFVLSVEPWYGEYFGQIYGEKLYNGQFDLSYDKISLSSFNQYMCYNSLSSDLNISNNLTINWSIDTNNIDDDCIVYNGYRFTYDYLLTLLNN